MIIWKLPPGSRLKGLQQIDPQRAKPSARSLTSNAVRRSRLPRADAKTLARIDSIERLARTFMPSDVVTAWSSIERMHLETGLTGEALAKVESSPLLRIHAKTLLWMKEKLDARDDAESREVAGRIRDALARGVLSVQAGIDLAQPFATIFQVQGERISTECLAHAIRVGDQIVATDNPENLRFYFDRLTRCLPGSIPLWTHEPLDFEYFVRVRALPVYPIGLIEHFESADAVLRDAVEFPEHDLRHGNLMQQEDGPNGFDANLATDVRLASIEERVALMRELVVAVEKLPGDGRRRAWFVLFVVLHELSVVVSRDGILHGLAGLPDNVVHDIARSHFGELDFAADQQSLEATCGWVRAILTS